jgi:hypothetical protein
MRLQLRSMVLEDQMGLSLLRLKGKLGSAPRVTFSTLAGFAGNAVKLHGLVEF